jgi:mannose-6-phosphate isomerase-like protein (cupin superfamily)
MTSTGFGRKVVDVAAEPLEQGDFDATEYADELREAPSNLAVGTSVLLENDQVKVWEVRLAPGERGAFHAHTHNYFWTCVDGSVGLQRYPDGTYMVRRYEVGQTQFSEHSADEPLIHDLENVGDTELRFITVELLGRGPAEAPPRASRDANLPG